MLLDWNKCRKCIVQECPTRLMSSGLDGPLHHHCDTPLQLRKILAWCRCYAEPLRLGCRVSHTVECLMFLLGYGPLEIQPGGPR